MFSEINASGNAKQFESILRSAIKTGNPDIITFCNEHIYPKYQWELGDAFDKPDKEIEEYFEKLKK